MSERTQAVVHKQRQCKLQWHTAFVMKALQFKYVSSSLRMASTEIYQCKVSLSLQRKRYLRYLSHPDPLYHRIPPPPVHLSEAVQPRDSPQRGHHAAAVDGHAELLGLHQPAHRVQVVVELGVSERGRGQWSRRAVLAPCSALATSG